MVLSKSKSTKPSKVVKPKQARRKTLSTRQHRFQPFSERISTLKIDPIRRRRHQDDREELVDDKDSYFNRSLARWRDTNLSGHFTAFAREVAPLSDNLPIVLHNHDRIMTAFVGHIEKGDQYALEPLLALLADFARDLDTRFEQHFELAVRTVATVAAQHSDPAVIEWSFNCLAWLFKYLSRLLAPDLRPVYNLMSPYLGKEVQKPFIIRFAAESLSFLLRKTAASYERSPDQLETIIEHILEDVESEKANEKADLHRQGVMTLISESVRGLQGALHSSGSAILQTLFKCCVSGESKARTAIVTGILTTLIHSSSAETFKPVADLICNELFQLTQSKQDMSVAFYARVLFTIISVRKGTRIEDWTLMLNRNFSLLISSDATAWTDLTKWQILSALAAAVTYCPTSFTREAKPALDALQAACWSSNFLNFCDYISRLDQSRFERLILHRLQSYVSNTTFDNQSLESCLIALPHILGAGNERSVTLPDTGQTKISAFFEASPDIDIDRAWILINALRFLKLSTSMKGKLTATLAEIIQRGLNSGAADSRFRKFALGPCLQSWLSFSLSKEDLEPVFQQLCSASQEMATVASFWTSMRTAMKMVKSPPDATKELSQAMLIALRSPSHPIRECVLDIASSMLSQDGQDIPQTLQTARLIESTPISLDTMRSISLNIRRLGTEYAADQSHDFIVKAIPAYCFGLLQLRLSQAWTDAIASLQEISKVSAGEDFIIDVVQHWLQSSKGVEEAAEVPVLIQADNPSFQVVSDFECPNLARLSAMAQQISTEENSGYPSPQHTLHEAIDKAPIGPLDERGQALRVLDKLHIVAEKRSRLLVPILLNWAGSDSSAEQDVESDRWSRKDQKALLNIFAQFQNPRVLYKSAEVHDALLELCRNGDVEIQKAALQALLAWKEAVIVRYREHLTNLMDDSRFREELSVFLQGDDEDSLRQEDLPLVMPILLRLLYGRLVGGSKESQQARRKAVFVALSSKGIETTEMFVDIALSQAAKVKLVGTQVMSMDTLLSIPLRQQLGMLNMLSDMLSTLGSALQPMVAKLVDPILGCTINAQEQLLLPAAERNDASLLRAVRQNGILCLVKIFASIEDPELVPRASLIASRLLLQRADNFVSDNTEGVSANLRLIATLATRSKLLRELTLKDEILLQRVAELLGNDDAKPDVKQFILTDIVGSLGSDDAKDIISSATIDSLVTSIATILQRGATGDLLSKCVTTLINIAERIDNAARAQQILDICSFLLVQPAQSVSGWTKTGLLRAMVPLLALEGITIDQKLYQACSGLFSRIRDVEGRAVLSEVFYTISNNDAGRQEAADICRKLNATSSGRLGVPDLDERELGFAEIYEKANTFSAEQWSPILHNCLYFILDEEDTVNRASAAKALQSLISTSFKDEQVTTLIQNQLFPAVQRGMSARSEFVRSEQLRLLGEMVKVHSDWDELSDMHNLTVGGDDEASFFENVLHIQQHRRLRALRRLGEDCKVRSRNIVRIFLPLLEQFIFEQAAGDAGRTLADQAIQTIGLLAARLKWSDLRKTFQRYAAHLKKKTESEKIALRLLGALVDGFSAGLNHRDAEMNGLDGEQMDDQTASSERQVLPENRARVIMQDFLPPLLEFLHHKDESDVDRRVGVAITVAKLLRLLPEEEFVARLAPMLTDVAHILRSREIEAREQTRRTLSTIITLIGPTYLGYMLKELRSALQKGYQLHVLSYSVHHILVTAGSSFKVGDIDECLPDLIAIVLDDIFGVTGQEKDAEEYKSSMKEIKSSKSGDTLEIIARLASISHMGQLILPIRALLQEKLDGRTVKKIDDLLGRIRRGIDLNPEADSRDMLAFCHELVRQVYQQQALSAQEAGLQDWKLKKYLMRAKPSSGLKNATTSYIFKLTAFALSLVRKVLRRHEDLRTAANMAGFLPMIGDGLVSGEQEVKIEAAKLLSNILGIELPELDKNAAVYLKEAILMVRGSTSTVSETARAGLELATGILRERRDIAITERDVAALLLAIKADLDEPDRQGQSFRFLRAVLGRKIVITEVYEVMDEVAKIMVSAGDEIVRQNARAAYVTFVIDFPQAKDRWTSTTSFLIKNLNYQHAGGRRSVQEAIHTLLGRLDRELVQSMLIGLFVALVQRVIGDSDTACRQGATVLLDKVLELADEDVMKQMKTLASKWLKDESKVSIRQAAIACFAGLVRLDRVNKKEIDILLNTIHAIVGLEPGNTSTSQLQIASLDVLLKLSEMHSERTFATGSAELLSDVEKLLAQPDAEIQIRAAKLTGLLFDDVARNMAKSGGLASTDLRSSGGMSLSMDYLCNACTSHLRCLRVIQAEHTELATSVVRNIVFLGRVFAANKASWRKATAEDESEASDEDEVEDGKHTALGYLISRLTFAIRREGLPVLGRIAAVQTVQALLHIPNISLPNLQMLTKALYVLTDPAIPQPAGDAHKALTDHARELMDAIQEHVGAEAYIKLLSSAQKQVSERRQERQKKRKIDAVSHPERWVKEKQRRHEVKKAKSKAKVEMNRSRRRGW